MFSADTRTSVVPIDRPGAARGGAAKQKFPEAQAAAWKAAAGKLANRNGGAR
jgi:hypothetical protein